MSHSWAAGSTRRWRRTRAQVLQRDQYQCQIKITGTCTTTATTVHHTLGRAVTGDDPAHLQAACAPCNLAIGEPGARPNDPPPRRMTTW